MTSDHKMQDTAVADSSIVTYAGAVGAVTAWGFKLSEFVAIASMLIAFGGLCLQFYYIVIVQRRRD